MQGYLDPEQNKNSPQGGALQQAVNNNQSVLDANSQNLQQGQDSLDARLAQARYAANAPGTVTQSPTDAGPNSAPIQTDAGIPQQGAPQQQGQDQGAPGVLGLNPTPTGAQQQEAPNGWAPPPGYLQGSTNQQLNPQMNPANMSGAAQKGYAEGQIAGQQLLNAKDENARANETQGWRRQEVLKQQQISAGMQQAAAQGGYGGVIDYLRTADPDRAIQFQTAKTQLDQSMLKSDSMAMLNKQQQQAALFQGYGLLGKMGATILQAPAGERQALYTQMMPMVKAVVPDAPTDVNAAGPMLMLGAGQAMPDSVRWQANEDNNQAVSDIGKANTDLQNYYAKGGKSDDPVAQALQAKINSNTQEGILRQSTLDELKTKQASEQADAGNKQLATVASITKNLNDNPFVKNYMQIDPAYRRFLAATQALQANHEDPNAIKQMQAAVLEINGIKRMNPSIMSAMTGTDNEMQEKMDEFASTISKQGKVVMSHDAVGRMSKMLELVHDQMAAPVEQIQNIYKSQADTYGGTITKKDGTTAQARDMVPWINTGSKMPNTQPVPTREQIEQSYQQHIANGDDPNVWGAAYHTALQRFGYSHGQ